MLKDEYSEQEGRLIARGVLTPPCRRRKPGELLPEPSGYVLDEIMQKLWREEREGRWI